MIVYPSLINDHRPVDKLILCNMGTAHTKNLNILLENVIMGSLYKVQQSTEHTQSYSQAEINQSWEEF